MVFIKSLESENESILKHLIGQILNFKYMISRIWKEIYLKTCIQPTVSVHLLYESYQYVLSQNIYLN